MIDDLAPAIIRKLDELVARGLAVKFGCAYLTFPALRKGGR